MGYPSTKPFCFVLFQLCHCNFSFPYHRKFRFLLLYLFICIFIYPFLERISEMGFPSQTSFSLFCFSYATVFFSLYHRKLRFLLLYLFIYLLLFRERISEIRVMVQKEWIIQNILLYMSRTFILIHIASRYRNDNNNNDILRNIYTLRKLKVIDIKSATFFLEVLLTCTIFSIIYFLF